VLVLKGALIANGLIVGPKSVVTAKQCQPLSLLAGQPAVVKLEGVDWSC
jgi:acetyltransferase-like isoleucine patch superfamily enzyme